MGTDVCMHGQASNILNTIVPILDLLDITQKCAKPLPSFKTTLEFILCKNLGVNSREPE